MDPLTTSYIPCLTCMNDVWKQPEAKRCRHDPNCTAHDGTCGCKVYTSPSLCHSKIGAVLHLQWTEPDGTFYNIDVDINCPNLPITTPYNGFINVEQDFLSTNRPERWLEEYKKLEDMSAVRNQLHVKRSVRLRLVNRGLVMARQVSTEPSFFNKIVTR